MCGVVACFIRFENESFAGDVFMRRPIFSLTIRYAEASGVMLRYVVVVFWLCALETLWF